MKIGILTFHRAHNYGAVLQAYALQTYIKSLGHDAKIIDYKPKYLKYGLFIPHEWLAKNPIKCLSKIVKQISIFFIKVKRHNAFLNFINDKMMLDKINLDSINNDFDLYIIGSDQVWRPIKGGTDKYDDIFFGEFNARKGKKVISYAASMGGIQGSRQSRKYFTERLEKFNYISVREDSLKKFLELLTKKEVKTVVDPTFLVEKKFWDSLLIKPKIKTPYLLLYQVNRDEQASIVAKNIANYYNFKLIEVTSKVLLKNNKNKNLYQCASPQQFLGLIKYANFIVTTSFHGTAFSLIFEKPFLSIKLNKTSDCRIESLLKRVELSNRFINKNESVDFDQIVKPITFYFDKEIMISQHFINESIDC